MADACCIQEPQGTVAFRTPFLEIERVIGRATKAPIRLHGKGRTRKAMSKGGSGELGRSIDNRRRWRVRLLRHVGRRGLGLVYRSKFGGAQFGWRKRLPQFQPDIPCPLSQDLGKLLAPRSVRVPAIHLLLLIFIGEHCFKRAAMQVQGKDIRSRKPWGGKGADKQLIDHPIAFGANSRIGGCSRMGRDDQAHFGSGWCQGHGRTIVERALHATFCMRADRIWSTPQLRLHPFQIKQVVGPTSHDHA